MTRFLKKSYAALIYLFLYAPILILLVFSFNASKSGELGRLYPKMVSGTLQDRQIMKAA